MSRLYDVKVPLISVATLDILTQLSNDMTSLLQFYDRIRAWLWLFEHVPFPESADPLVIELNGGAERNWRSEMLPEVAAWEVPLELIGTSVEAPLLTAIRLASTADHAQLTAIRDLLLCVERFISDHHLADHYKN